MYHPLGSLSIVNTPNGPQQKVLSARILHNRRTSRHFGLGGLVVEGAAAEALPRPTTEAGRFGLVNVVDGQYSHDAASGVSAVVNTQQHRLTAKRGLNRRGALERENQLWTTIGRPHGES